MITEDLVAYIQSQIKKNTPKERIVSRLTQAGWHSEDIAEGFAKLLPITPPFVSPTRPAPLVTPAVVAAVHAAPAQEPKVWVPMSLRPAVAETKTFVPELKPVELEPHPVSPQMPAGLSMAFGQNPVSPAPIVQPASVLHTAVAPEITKPTADSIAPTPITPQKDNLTTSVSSILGGQQVPMTSMDTHMTADSTLPTRAMISSYKQDTMSTHKVEASSPKQNTKMTKKVLIAVCILLVLGGVGFVFAKGYIKIPDFTTSLVKKDPKSILLEAATKFATLKSYKSDISTSLTTPSFAAITSGLVTGDSVRTGDLESVSIDAKGQVTNSTALMPRLATYTATLKSSLLNDEITSTWRYNNATSYIDVPSLAELFGAQAPPEATVAIPNGQFGVLLPELSQTVQDMVKQVDVYNVISKGVSPYLQSKTTQAFAAFMDTVTVNEKDDETIHGVPSYHYSIEASRQNTKILLTDLFDLFATSLPDDQKKSIDEGLGAVSIDSFDVWVGKDDSMLHQYEFTLTAPLSKVIALDDKGIAGKEVTFHFKNTFYDLDIPNSIKMPPSSVPITDFVKIIRDTKIKNIVSTFAPTAKSLSNAEGGYGKKPNPTGSCTNPAPGSLFSPVGHIPGASSQVGLVASTMNTLLAATGGAGSCYSTASAWALATPLASNPASYFCADSTGASLTLENPISGTLCK